MKSKKCCTYNEFKRAIKRNCLKDTLIVYIGISEMWFFTHKATWIYQFLDYKDVLRSQELSDCCNVMFVYR